MSAVFLEYKESVRIGASFRFMDSECPDEDTDVVVTVEDWFESLHTHGYALRIDGVLTLGQLHELVHKIGQELLSGPMSAQDAAAMARGNSLTLRKANQ